MHEHHSTGNGLAVNQLLFPKNITVILRFTFRTCQKLEYFFAACNLPSVKQKLEDFELWLFKRALHRYRGIKVECDSSNSQTNSGVRSAPKT